MLWTLQQGCVLRQKADKTEPVGTPGLVSCHPEADGFTFTCPEQPFLSYGLCSRSSSPTATSGSTTNKLVLASSAAASKLASLSNRNSRNETISLRETTSCTVTLEADPQLREIFFSLCPQFLKIRNKKLANKTQFKLLRVDVRKIP